MKNDIIQTIEIAPEDFFTSDELENILGIDMDKNKEEENFSTWINYGKDYGPAVNLQTVDKLPNGIYKMREDRDGLHIVPTTIKTDELYKFHDGTIDTVLSEIQDFWDRKEIYKQHNIMHKRGLLLEGTPGCGKTALISLLANDIVKQNGIVFLINTIKDLELFCDNIVGTVRKIEPDRPIITIIEDIDKMIENMNTDAPILDLLDGKTAIEHHLVIMTSNDTSDLSPALLRPSRVDMRFVVDPPIAKTRKEFFTKKGIKAKDLKEYVDKTDGLSFAQMKEVFIGTQILGKPLDKTIQLVVDPAKSKDYLGNKKKKINL